MHPDCVVIAIDELGWERTDTTLFLMQKGQKEIHILSHSLTLPWNAFMHP